MWGGRTVRARSYKMSTANSTLLNSQHKSHNVTRHIMGWHGSLAVSSSPASRPPHPAHLRLDRLFADQNAAITLADIIRPLWALMDSYA